MRFVFIGPDTVTAEHAQIHSGNFVVQDATRSGSTIDENNGKIVKIVEYERRRSTVSIFQKTIWNHLKRLDTKNISMYTS